MLAHDAFTWALAQTIESINAAWTVLDLCLVIYFAYYLYTVKVKCKLSWPSIFKWSSRLPMFVQAAIAIFIFHVGDTGVRGLVWIIRHRLNEGHSINYQFAAPATAVLAVFAFIAGFGLLCKLRVFSTPLLGQWVWVTGASLAFVAAVLTHWLP